MRTLISAFVVSYNRADRIETCLKSLQFADELIVVDKGSSDDTRRIAAGYADRVLTVPWSPTVEATRQFALTHCSHDLVVFLDDDEVLSVPGIEYILERARVRPFDALALPVRHYVLGRHDEKAYYWPERHVRAFRKGCVEFGDTVHAGIRFLSGQVEEVELDTGICVHNVSYRDTRDWLEKTNRYTAAPDRCVAPGFSPEHGLRAYIQDRTDHWFGMTDTHTPYVDAVSALRVVYDVVDLVKSLESTIGVHADSDFAAVLETLSQELDVFLASPKNSTSVRLRRNSRVDTRDRQQRPERSISWALNFSRRTRWWALFGLSIVPLGLLLLILLRVVRLF